MIAKYKDIITAKHLHINSKYEVDSDMVKNQATAALVQKAE